MDKKYTFFISSTFSDLSEERKIVSNLVLNFDEIPVGMEQFGSVDVSQWTHITRLIDNSDYYVLIVAGKYGSIDPTDALGVSYTHKEFRYARDKGIPVIAIIHSDPEALPMSKCESDPALKKKLEEFRAEVKEGRLVSFYTNHSELIQRFSAGFIKAKQTFDRPGWIRNVNLLAEDQVKKLVLGLQERVKLLEKINNERGTEITLLKGRAKAMSYAIPAGSEDIAKALNPLEGAVTIPMTWHEGSSTGELEVVVERKSLFIMIAMLVHRNQLKTLSDVSRLVVNFANHLARSYAKEYTGEGTTFSVYDSVVYNLAADFLTNGLLRSVDGRIEISEIGAAFLDWMD